jgi:hypothetical protein
VQKLLDEVKAQYVNFVDQPDRLVMVVTCPDTECAYHLRILKSVDEENSTDFFWSFAEPFTEPSAYIDAIVTSVKHLITDINADKDGSSWPEPPTVIQSAGADPVSRTREVMTFCRSLLPGRDQRIVWSFFPLTIADPSLWMRFVTEVTAHELPLPWCHHMRIIVREAAGSTMVSDALGGARWATRYSPDLSISALNRSAEDAVSDESLPLERRCQSLLILAANDYSYRRYPEALEKYEVLLFWYRNTRNPMMTAVVMNGIGEAHWRMGNAPIAQTWFEGSLEHAMQVDARPAALNAALNMANMKMEIGAWEEAAEYYGSAEKLATAQMIPITRAQCLDNQCYCLQQLGRYEEAREGWMTAADIAQRSGESDLYQRITHRMHSLSPGRARLLSDSAAHI